MSSLELSEQTTPAGSEILLRTIKLQYNGWHGSIGNNKYDTIYGPIESAIVGRWSKNGYVFLRFGNRSIWVDPKEYQLCEVLWNATLTINNK